MLRKSRGYWQGFDIYDDKMEDEDLVRHMPERIAENTTSCAIRFLKKYSGHTFFMWIHYQDPHGPYTPPDPDNNFFVDTKEKPFDLKFNETMSGNGGIPSYQKLGKNKSYHYYVAQYDGEIRYFDEQFKYLIEALKKLKIYDNSIIILTADHGEEMGERNYFFCHGGTLYNNLLHIPLIIKFEKGFSGRRRDFIQHIDITPTIFNIIGIETDVKFRGRNFLGEESDECFIFSERMGSAYNKYEYSIIKDGWKLIYNENKEYLLFNLSEDPHEQNNLINNIDYNKYAIFLEKKLDNIRTENLLGFNIRIRSSRLTDEEKEKLKSLGYVK